MSFQTFTAINATLANLIAIATLVVACNQQPANSPSTFKVTAPLPMCQATTTTTTTTTH